MVSLGRTLVSSISFVIAWLHSGAPRGGRVHSDSRGFTRTRLGVAWFVRVRVGSLWRILGSSGSFVFAWFHSCAPSGHRVHWGSGGVTRVLLGVVGFILVDMN